MGLILSRWGLILPRIPPPAPVLYSDVTHPFWGYVCTQKTPIPLQNTPIPGLNLKKKPKSGQPGPLLGKMFEKWTKLF